MVQMKPYSLILYYPRRAPPPGSTYRPLFANHDDSRMPLLETRRDDQVIYVKLPYVQQ